MGNKIYFLMMPNVQIHNYLVTMVYFSFKTNLVICYLLYPPYDCNGEYYGIVVIVLYP